MKSKIFKNYTHQYLISDMKFNEEELRILLKEFLEIENLNFKVELYLDDKIHFNNCVDQCSWGEKKIIDEKELNLQLKRKEICMKVKSTKDFLLSVHNVNQEFYDIFFTFTPIIYLNYILKIKRDKRDETILKINLVDQILENLELRKHLPKFTPDHKINSLTEKYEEIYSNVKKICDIYLKEIKDNFTKKYSQSDEKLKVTKLKRREEMSYEDFLKFDSLTSKIKWSDLKDLETILNLLYQYKNYNIILFNGEEMNLLFDNLDDVKTYDINTFNEYLEIRDLVSSNIEDPYYDIKEVLDGYRKI